jgi:phage terminase large subunit
MANRSISIKDLKISFDGNEVYDPLPHQIKFHTSPAKYRLFGGSCGGGKTYAIMAEAIMRSFKYDFPLTGAIFRRSFPELDSTIIRGMLTMLPNWLYKYNQAQHVMTLRNGSIIEFCYAETDADVIRYQSREWDWLGIDELTHFSAYQFTYLCTRVRTIKPINTKVFAGSNPGGRGHAWVKEKFVTKDCKDDNYNPNDYDFIPAGIMDNPYLMKNNPDYLENLKMLPEDERKRLLEGDWDAQAGMFFTEWSPSRHVVDDFDVPEDWQLILGWDDGTREPRAVNLYAIDNDQKVWCVWEYYRAEENLDEAAKNIRNQLKEKGLWGRIYKCVVDPSMKRQDSQTGISSIEVLEDMGFGFHIGEVELGNNNRVEGWRVMKTYLSHKPYEEPLLKFFRSCENIIRTIPDLMYYQPRSGASSKKEDLDCFIAGTKVDTMLGKKNVEDIKEGDYVRTPIGYRKVIKDGISGISHGTAWAQLSNGQRLEGTPDHRVYVQGKGLVELQNLSVGDILQEKNIYLWKQKKSGTKEYSIVGTPLVGTIAQMGAILKRGIPHFIGRCILTTTEKFQRAWQYITRTVTKTTTAPRTLNYSTTQYTANSILKREKTYKRSLRSGGSHQKGRRRLERTQEKCMKEPRPTSTRANIVKNLLKRKQKPPSFAQRVVSTTIGWISNLLKFVPFVEKSLKQLIRKLEPVHISAVGHCEGSKVVYNLTVEEAHLYYANGVLVTNTTQEDHSADNARYVLMSLDRLPSRFGSANNFEVKRREYKPKSSFK